MKTVANQFVLDVFVIIERAINGIVLQHDVSHSFIYQWWHLFSSGTLMMSVFFVTHQMHLQATIFKRLLLRHLRRMHGSAALYRFTISNSACFSISDPAQVLLLRSTFGLFPHHFVEHFRGRCAQDVAFGKRLKLLAGLVLMFSLLENSSIHRNQVPIHFGLLCDMREELSDTKWQDCDPQSWSLWYDANVMACLWIFVTVLSGGCLPHQYLSRNAVFSSHNRLVSRPLPMSFLCLLWI